jgi:glutamyl-tRNA reductase
MKKLVLLGVDYRRAPLGVLEKMCLTPAECLELCRAARGLEGIAEACVVATCNRVEFLLVTDGDLRSEERWLAAVRRFKPAAPARHGACSLYRLEESQAVLHLARVAGGLESAILGDAQICGQLRAALVRSAQAGSLGPVLSAVFRSVLRAGARARRQTSISRGAASLGSAVYEEILSRGRALPEARVLILGAGDAARDVAQHLAKRGLRRMTIINRTPGKAAALAAACGALSREWGELAILLADADILVSAVRCDSPVVCGADLRRRGPGLLVVDLGMPRSVEAGDGPELISLESLAARRDEACRLRADAVPEVEMIVAAEAGEWAAWRAGARLESALKKLFLSEPGCRESIVRGLSALSPGVPAASIDKVVHDALGAALFRHARTLRKVVAPALAERRPA